VALTIEIEPPEVAVRKQLQQRVAAELQARDIEVCPLAQDPQRVAQVRLQTSLPELSPTLVRIKTSAGATLERRLDFASLPREARPSAIASATDELLSTLLQTALLQTALPQTGQPVSERSVPVQDSVPTRAALPDPPAARPLPVWELGLGGGAARFAGQGRTYTGELLARWRPLARLAATARLGGDWGRADASFASPQLARGWHAGLDAGFELLQPVQGFALAADAGLILARAQHSVELEILTPVGSGLQHEDRGSSWEAAASVGAEASFHTGPFGVALGLAALLPLTATVQPPLQMQENENYVAIAVFTERPVTMGLGEKLGGELTLRLWVALDSPG
jgi:hypothetical protein